MTWYSFINYVHYLICEKPRGLDFSPSDFSYVSPDSSENYYSRTDKSTLTQLVSVLNLSQEDSFLDIGCGKGLVLYYFAKKTHCKLAGIEKFEPLVQLAKQNFRTLGLADRIQVITIDAKDFLNYADYNVFFMFNPFKQDVAQRVMECIVKSLSINPRKIRIISVQPFFNQIIEGFGFQVDKTIRSRLTGVETRIYIQK